MTLTSLSSSSLQPSQVTPLEHAPQGAVLVTTPYVHSHTHRTRRGLHRSPCCIASIRYGSGTLLHVREDGVHVVKLRGFGGTAFLQKDAVEFVDQETPQGVTVSTPYVNCRQLPHT